MLVSSANGTVDKQSVAGMPAVQPYISNPAARFAAAHPLVAISAV